MGKEKCIQMSAVSKQWYLGTHSELLLCSLEPRQIHLAAQLCSIIPGSISHRQEAWRPRNSCRFTVPLDILPTQQRPDLVLVNRKEKVIFLIELTICFETNFEAANARKTERYQNLKNDIEDRGFKCHLMPLEVGSGGHISKKNKFCIINILKMNNIPLKYTELLKSCSKISLLCSYSIFNAYSQPTWSDPPLLTP